MNETAIFDADMTWASDGACIGKPREWFFPGDHHSTGYMKGREVCLTCPVFDACQAHGIQFEEHGMWGGLTGRQRRAIREGAPIPDIRKRDQEDTPRSSGRPKKLTPAEIREAKASKLTRTALAKKFGISRRALYQYLTDSHKLSTGGATKSTGSRPIYPQSQPCSLSSTNQSPGQRSNAPRPGAAPQEATQ